MKGFVDILPAPAEFINWLSSVVVAESVQSLTGYVELKKVERLGKVKKRRTFKVANTSRAGRKFPARDEPSANP
jgi:hypothetical protein